MDDWTSKLLRRQLRARFPAGQGKLVPRTEIDRQRAECLHLVFPLGKHDEAAWGRRFHIPSQLGLGLAADATRVRNA